MDIIEKKERIFEEDKLFLDNKDFQAKFMLTPEFKDLNDYQEDIYSHIGKDAVLTNLKDNPQYNINEVKEAQYCLVPIHILKNPKHYRKLLQKEIVYEPDGEVERIVVNEQTGQETLVIFPKYKAIEKETIRFISKYPKTIHKKISIYHSMMVTTSARNGFRMLNTNTQKLIKEESIQNKTQANPNGLGGLFGGNKQDSNQY